MRIKYQNNAMVVVSGITAVDFATAKQFAPQSLQVKDDKGNTVFAVSDGSAQIKPFATQFNAVVDGNMAVTVPFNMGVAGEEAKETIKTQYAVGLAALAAHEDTIVAQIGAAVAPVTAVMESIEME